LGEIDLSNRHPLEETLAQLGCCAPVACGSPRDTLS
jgi:hypothetical protein